jgi:transposase-like protein
MPLCPSCCSSHTVKNGHIHNGKQRFKCHECGRQFIEHPEKKVIDSATRELIDRLLLERISLAGIARVTEVSEQWLQNYVNDKYASVPRNVQVTPKKRGGSQFNAMSYGHL